MTGRLRATGRSLGELAALALVTACGTVLLVDLLSAVFWVLP